MRLRRPQRRSDRGLSRPEILWTVMLAVVIVGLIVRTRGAELDRSRERWVADSLHYLQAQVNLAMELADTRGEPVAAADFPFVGPGELPRGLDPEQVSRLEDLLGGLYVPEDAWQRAFVLRLVGRPDAQRVQLLSAGADGILPGALEEAPAYAKPVHGPYALDAGG